jgi:hypothetical protein
MPPWFLSSNFETGDGTPGGQESMAELELLAPGCTAHFELFGAAATWSQAGGAPPGGGGGPQLQPVSEAWFTRWWLKARPLDSPLALVRGVIVPPLPPPPPPAHHQPCALTIYSIPSWIRLWTSDESALSNMKNGDGSMLAPEVS